MFDHNYQLGFMLYIITNTYYFSNLAIKIRQNMFKKIIYFSAASFLKIVRFF
jgi:hypothetical protein